MSRKRRERRRSEVQQVRTSNGANRKEVGASPFLRGGGHREQRLCRHCLHVGRESVRTAPREEKRK